MGINDSEFGMTGLPVFEVTEVEGQLRRQTGRHSVEDALALVQDDGQIRSVCLKVSLANARPSHSSSARLVNCHIEGARIETDGWFPVGSRLKLLAVDQENGATIFTGEFVTRNRSRVELSESSPGQSGGDYLFGGGRDDRFEAQRRIVNTCGLECFHSADEEAATHTLYKLLLHTRVREAIH